MKILISLGTPQHMNRNPKASSKWDTPMAFQGVQRNIGLFWMQCVNIAK